MTLPFYQGSAAAARQIAPGMTKTANTGLWHTRFYDAFEPDWNIDKQGKRDWIDKTVRLGPSGDADQLARLAGRQGRLCEALGGVTVKLETTGPFVTGMGLSHPVENGFTFHPTLGMPYLPASGVKGLLRGWVEAWMDHDEATRNAVTARWFGAAKGNEQDMPESAGNLIFFDALPTSPVHLGCDIMTPHMGDWYEKGGDISQASYATTAPADWHSPVPVPFLVVKKGTAFQFMIAPRLTGDASADMQTRMDVTAAMKELKNALEWIGAGAKTATGYGRMVDRVAEAAQQSAANLAKAGIQSGETLWEKANVSWSKGKATLTVTNQIPDSNGKKQTASQTGEKGKQTYQSFSEAARKRLDKEKPVIVKATVSILGNSTTLLSIEEIP